MFRGPLKGSLGNANFAMLGVLYRRGDWIARKEALARAPEWLPRKAAVDALAALARKGLSDRGSGSDGAAFTITDCGMDAYEDAAALRGVPY